MAKQVLRTVPTLAVVAALTVLAGWKWAASLVA